ncbi:MAG TPA: TolC family protein [Acidobacteriaceae bacterium]|nr:TolC family protein [Acidobacteriaceae bacterium]
MKIQSSFNGDAMKKAASGTLFLTAILLSAGMAVAQQQSMPDMETPKAALQTRQTPTKALELEIPGDMRNLQNSNDRGARREAQSEENSEQQQSIEGAKGGPRSDSGSVIHPTLTLEEPENPRHVTMQNLPAPNLLQVVEHRAPMTLQDFLSRAEHGNPTLAEARADTLRARAQARQAGLYPNPSIGYSGDQIRGGSYGGGEQGGYLQQKIVLGGKLRLRRNIRREEARENEIALEEQQARVRNEITHAFYRALATQTKVAVRRRILQIALDAAQTAHQLANVGQADAPDILQAQVEAGQARIDYVTEQRNYLRDFQLLSAMCGAQNLSVAALQGDLEKTPVLDAAHEEDKILADSPAVKRARQAAAVAEAQLKDARRESVPDLTLRAGEWYSGEYVTGSHIAAGPESFASIGINLPVWNHNQGNVEAAKLERDRAEAEIDRVKLAIKQVAEPLVQEYLTAQYEAEQYRTDLIPGARRAYELYLMKYQQMASSYPQVLISQRTLFQLQIGYVTALNQIWSSSSALQNYMLTGGLQLSKPAGSSSTTINLPNGGGSE